MIAIYIILSLHSLIGLLVLFASIIQLREEKYNLKQYEWLIVWTWWLYWEIPYVLVLLRRKRRKVRNNV